MHRVYSNIYNERRHVSSHSFKKFRGSLSIEIQRRRKNPQAHLIKALQRNYYIQHAQSENNAQGTNNAQGQNQDNERRQFTQARSSVVPQDTTNTQTPARVATEKKKGAVKKHDEDPLEIVLFHAGEIGWYQWYMFAWMLPFGFFFAWVYFVQMFIVATPMDHYCHIPALANLTLEERRKFGVPHDSRGRLDHCNMFDVDWDQVLATGKRPPESTRRVPCKYGWDYEFTDIPYSTVSTERNWVCSNAKNVPTAQAIFFIGALLGCFSFGWMADHYGRIPALMGSNLFGAIGGVATVFTSGYWDFVACRFISGMALDNNFMLIYILALEYVGPSHRTYLANIAYAVYFGGGNVTLPWVAYVSMDWRKTMWMTSLPMFVVLLAPWFVPESARWLVSRGRVEEAVKVLKNFASVNGKVIPASAMNDFIISANRELSEHVEESLFVIFHSGPLRHTAIYMLIVYCGSGIVYDALVRLSEAFGLNFFITFTLTGALEIPAVLLLAVFLDRFGRRNLSYIPLLIAGVTILCAMAVPKGLPRVCFAVVARFFMHMAFTAETQWSTEILPTPFRASGSAALHMSAFASCLISPFIVFSRIYWQLLPLLILGIISLIVAAITLLLPETKGLPMPQTIPDAEDIIANKCLFHHVKNAPRRPSRFTDPDTPLVRPVSIK